MSVDLAALRTKLLFHCPSLHSGLAVKDLEQLQWSTKQKLLINIFEQLHLLADQFNDMTILIDERNLKLSEMKSALIDKEKRIEVERDFRTNFLRHALKGLERLRWPKSLEAFADPLKDLMTDPTTFLQAIDYLVMVGFNSGEVTRPLSSASKPKRKTVKDDSFISPLQSSSFVIDNSLISNDETLSHASQMNEQQVPVDYSLNAFEVSVSSLFYLEIIVLNISHQLFLLQ